MNAKVEEIDLKKDVEIGQEGGIDTTIESKNVELVPDWSEAEAQEAESMGWIPPDRSKKLPEGKTFLGPKEFMERNPLYRKMKSLESTVGQLNSHHHRVLENEQKKAEKHYAAELDRLKAEKVAALDEGDNKRVVEIDEEIRTTEKPEISPESDPVFDAWVKENAWYENDKFLSVEADSVAEKYLAKGLRGKDVLDATAEHMKKTYKEHFEPESRDRPAAVEGDTRGGKRASSKNVSEKDLTADEREVFKNFERMGVFADEKAVSKYIKEVVDIRE